MTAIKGRKNGNQQPATSNLNPLANETQHAQTTATGPPTPQPPATTHTTRPTRCSRIHPSTTPSIDSGSGSFVMSHSFTGRSMAPSSLLSITLSQSSPSPTKQSHNHTIRISPSQLLLVLTLYSGAPSNVPSLVSRTVNAEYFTRQCALYFPTVNGYTYGSAKGRSADDINAWTKGWDLTETTRLTWTNG